MRRVLFILLFLVGCVAKQEQAAPPPQQPQAPQEQALASDQALIDLTNKETGQVDVIIKRYDQDKNSELKLYLDKLADDATKWTQDQKNTVAKWTSPLYTSGIMVLDDLLRLSLTTEGGIRYLNDQITYFRQEKIDNYKLLQDAGATPSY
jgi:hypothetical protein